MRSFVGWSLALVGSLLALAQPADRYVPADYLSGTLPVLHIDVESGDYIAVKEPYRQATCWMADTDGTALLGSELTPLALSIKGHGNATFTLQQKKPFRIKFDKKQSPLGLSCSKHFLLLSHADDFCGQIKDELGFELSRQLGLAWTPRQVPVELVLNGDYWGLYYLCEKIRVEGDRVNIEQQADGETDPALVTGGWLLEIDNYTSDGQIRLPAPDDKTIRVTVHSPDSLSGVQRDYVDSLLREVNDAVYDCDIDSGRWEEMIDIDSLALYYLVGEVVDDFEAFSGSCWFHKRRGQGQRIVFGPVWDFGQSLARVLMGTTTFLYAEPRAQWADAFWIASIARSRHFQDVVKRYFFDFIESGKRQRAVAHVTDFVDRIVVAGQCDRRRWSAVPTNALRYRMGVGLGAFNTKVDWLLRQWTDSEHHLLCDINLDAVVDVADMNIVLNTMLGKADQTAAADVSGDGAVDIADVNAIINTMLGKSKSNNILTINDL